MLAVEELDPAVLGCPVGLFRFVSLEPTKRGVHEGGSGMCRMSGRIDVVDGGGCFQ